MRPLLLLVVALAAGCPPAPETPACKQLRVCFYKDEANAEALGEVADGRYRNFAAGRGELIAAYGEGGTCYDGTDDSVCTDRCLCALRELCNDFAARQLTCDGEAAPPEGRCCDLEELRELESNLKDERSPNDDDTPDGLDDLCELPIDVTLPPRAELCVSPDSQ